MNIFVSDIIVVETDEDEKFLNNNLKLFGLTNSVKINNNYYINADNQTKKNVYIVKPLDTIYTIAKKINKDIEQTKKLLNGKYIFVGQKIYY